MSEPEGRGVDQAAFRRAVGQFPGGIVVVTTSGGHAMTVSAFASVSLEPPLVLFCAEKIARFHDAVLAAGSWAVSVLAEDAEKTARWLATRGRPLEGQLDEVPHHPGPVTDAPLLDGALATLECRTFAVYDGGDHNIVVGQVAAVTGPPDPPPAAAPPDGVARPDHAAPPDGVARPDHAAPPDGVAWPDHAAPPDGVAWPDHAAPPVRGPLLHHAGRYRRLRPDED